MLGLSMMGRLGSNDVVIFKRPRSCVQGSEFCNVEGAAMKAMIFLGCAVSKFEKIRHLQPHPSVVQSSITLLDLLGKEIGIWNQSH